jgi:hypothetical protein
MRGVSRTTTRMHDTIVRDYLWKLLAASEM